MTTQWLVTALAPGERAELAAALREAGLPDDEVDADDCLYLRFHDGNMTIGFAGVQGRGPDRLLRSFWITPALRRRGLGADVLARVEREALASGVARLHLLTTSAEAFFLRHGYARVQRAEAPPAIAALREFATTCPAGASYLARTIGS